MSKADDVRRGEEARQVLSAQVYKDSWLAYEQILIALLASADTSKDKAAEVRSWLIGARKARAHLERIMAEGQFAAEQIKLDEQKPNWRQRFRVAS